MLSNISSDRAFGVLNSFGDTNYRADLPVLFEDHGPQASGIDGDVPGCGCPSCCDARLETGIADVPFATVTDYTALLVPTSTNYLRWNWNEDTPAIGTTFITYSFREDAELPDPSTVSYSPDAMYSFSTAQRAETRDALAKYTAISGIVFVEAEEGGMLDFMGVTGSGFG
ncbi:MAG: hypothetical protein AAF216_02575, partial [Pseudomonadota bacterium]